MENEKGLGAWLVHVYRIGYEALVRFWCVLHGSEAAARFEDSANRTAREVPEKAP